MSNRQQEGRGGKPKTIASILDQALGALDLERARETAEVGECWERVVGPEVAKHCRPIGMKAGVLLAEVDSSVWCQQLQLRTPEILRALRGLMGSKCPADLRFRVGYTAPP